ncbi:MAG TPA: nuclear transport factor 2 family protein [Lapillicoccus sp.]|nr:nuclear transport factor 2 family protein [Lapillicoccus sp.]
MELLERIAAERACARLTYRYCEAVDLGHASRLADVFAEDGVFAAGGLHLVGREEIRRVFTEREQVRELRTRHVCSNLHIEVLDEASATGVVYLTLYRRRGSEDWSVPVPTTAPALVGSYHDHYARTADGWRIASRHQQVVFVDPTDTGWSPVGHDHLPGQSS